MQCPKCNMNVSDNAKMCLHCGTALQPTVNQSSQVVQNSGSQNNIVQNNVVQNYAPQNIAEQQESEENSIDEEELLSAYFGEQKYKDIKESKFSLGNFIFGFIWLVYERLYKTALGEALLTLGIGIATCLYYFYIFMENKTTSAAIGIPAIAVFVILFRILYRYASNLSTYSLIQANDIIANINEKTNNKEEKIALCKKAYKKNYFAFLLVPLVLGSFGFAIVSGVNTITMREKEQEEFESESNTYFQTASVLARTSSLVSEGKEANDGEFYYILIDDDMKDKEHPLSPIDNKDKKYFDGKGYVMIIMYNNGTKTHGFVCLNNGNDKKRFISLKAMNYYSIIENDKEQNSFHKLKIDKEGKCDISELVGGMNHSLSQLTAK